MTTISYIDFTSVMLLLFWIFAVVFAAYVISHAANGIVRFIASFTRSFKSGARYNLNYDERFVKKSSPLTKKVVKKNHGRGLPFVNRFR